MNEKTKELIVDSTARANQIVFTVLIVGPFVTGFNPWLFCAGIACYLFLLVIGIRITRTMKEE
jgi:hypothetical protein